MGVVVDIGCGSAANEGGMAGRSVAWGHGGPYSSKPSAGALFFQALVSSTPADQAFAPIV